MKNEFLVRMDVPEDCLIVTDGNGIYYRLFHAPVTGLQKNEIDCMQFHVPSEKTVEYHEHTLGTETFFVSQGKFYCYCMGRGFTMGPGDVFHVQPWMGHSFTPIEPESRLNIMFMGIDQRYAITNPRLRLMEKFPGVFENPDFTETFRNAHGGAGRRSVPTSPECPPESVTQLRRAGFGIREYEFEGVKLHLKVARYETEGVKEVWELFMKPGFFCEWDNFLLEYRVFYVTHGKLKCTVKTSTDEKLEFFAEKDNIIVIPPYNPFCFEVVEEARMYDMDCPARLQDLCEEIETFNSANPGKANDKASLMALFGTYGLNCTDFGYR